MLNVSELSSPPPDPDINKAPTASPAATPATIFNVLLLFLSRATVIRCRPVVSVCDVVNVL